MWKKVACGLISVMLIGGALAGCGTGNQSDSSGGKKTTLRWMLMGPGEQQDSKEVWAAFNEKLQEYMPGTQVEIEVIPSSEYAEKWRLLAASGEELDLAWTGFSLTYSDEVRKGSYKPLNELIDSKGQDLKKELPDFVWDLTSVDGKIYSVPNFQQMTYIPCILAQTELLEKYGNAQEIERVWKSSKEPTEAGYKLLEDYLSKAKAAGDIRQGMGGSMGQFRLTGYETITSIANVKKGDDTYKVVSELDVPGNQLYYRTVADWYKKGYIKNDILSVQNVEEYTNKEDGYILYGHQYLPGESERRTKTYGYGITAIPIDTEYFVANTPSTTSTVIPRTSKHPELAMQFIDLINTQKGKELYNMLVYGLEGKHYNKLADDRIETIGYNGASPTSNDKYGIQKWTVGNTFNAYLTQSMEDGYTEMLKEVHNNAHKSSLMGFSPDLNSIKTEVAQVQAVKTEYDKVLRFGAMDDFETTWNEYRNKMKLAGEEKIVQTVQEQLNEWLKTKQ